jgi:hypothetical protein
MSNLEDWWRATGRTEEAWNRYLMVLATFDPRRDSADSFAGLAAWACATAVYVPGSAARRDQLMLEAWDRVETIADPASKLDAWIPQLVAGFDEDDPDFGNNISVTHACEIEAYVVLARGSANEARALLQTAIDTYSFAEHLGCSLHCLETVGWWAGVAGQTNQGAELLGMVHTLRADLSRIRLAVKKLPHRGSGPSSSAG